MLLSLFFFPRTYLHNRTHSLQRSGQDQRNCLSFTRERVAMQAGTTRILQQKRPLCSLLHAICNPKQPGLQRFSLLGSGGAGSHPDKKEKAQREGDLSPASLPLEKGFSGANQLNLW